MHTTAAGSTFGVGAGVALVLVVLVIATAVRADPVSLGLAGGTWRGGLRLGFGIGGPVALVGGVGIFGSALVGRALGIDVANVTPAATVPWDLLLWRGVLLLWVDTAIPEEVAGQVAAEAMKVRDSEQKRLKDILSDDFLKQFERLSKYQ